MTPAELVPEAVKRELAPIVGRYMQVVTAVVFGGSMSILVVGSVAYDTVETPSGRAERVLGGSASFFAVAASFFAPVNLVGVVGDDFGEQQLAAFRDRPIDLAGLERVAGKTFHWQGRYSQDLNSRDTIRTDLNVFEFFSPKIPAAYRRSELRVPRQHRPGAAARGAGAGGEAARRGLRHHELLDQGQARRAARDARQRSTCC